MTWQTLHSQLAALVSAPQPAGDARLHEAVQLLHRQLGRASWTGIYFLRGETLTLGPFVGAPSPHTTIPLGRGLCGRAVRDNSDLDIGDVNAAPEYLACSLTTRSEAIALIRHEGETVGQIDIDSAQLGPFGDALMGELKRAADILAPLVAKLQRGVS